MKEELMKLIMESYNRGVDDTKAAALEAITTAIDAAIKAEREACAKVVEDWDSDGPDPRDIAAAIRARGQA